MVESTAKSDAMTAQDIIRLLGALEDRCHQYAVGLPEPDEIQNLWEGVMFYVGEDRLIAPLSDIKEILNFPHSITKVPGTKPWMLGVANIRGILLPIIDLQLYLIGRKTNRSRRSRVLVFQIGGGLTGVLVGEMVGMRHFAKDSATGKDALSGRFDRYIKYGFDQDGITWPVFKLSALADDPAFQIAAL
ncbi:MAG: chemotaxis protein CheW [Chromatiales bacterium]|jgi:twitching motility protein PilI